MKRRTFVRSAALGAMGLSLTPGILPFPFQQSGSQQWLKSLVNASGAKRRSIASESADSFRTLTESLQAYFSKRGYGKTGSDYYFYNAGGSYCFYTMKLQHGAHTMDDVLIPVLQLDPNGSWRHIRTLTGYQLEALAEAANALSGHAQPLQEILLPGAGRPAVPSHLGFNAQEAEVSISTRLSGGNAETSIAIMDRDQLIFNKIFKSRHSLTAFAAQV